MSTNTTTKTASTEAELAEWMEEQIEAYKDGTLLPDQLEYLDKNLPGWNDDAIIDIRIAEVDLAWRQAGWDGVNQTPAARVKSMVVLGKVTVTLYAALISFRLQDAADVDGVAAVATNWRFVEGAFLVGVEPGDVADYALGLPLSNPDVAAMLAAVAAGIEG